MDTMAWMVYSTIITFLLSEDSHVDNVSCIETEHGGSTYSVSFGDSRHITVEANSLGVSTTLQRTTFDEETYEDVQWFYVNHFQPGDPILPHILVSRGEDAA